MKQIIFITTGMRGGGTERVISVLANHFVKTRAVSILMIAENIVEYELDSNIEILPVAKTTGGSIYGRIKRIHAMRSYFRSHNNSVILGMGTVASMFTVLAAWGLPCFTAVSERNDPNRLNLKPITKFRRRLRNFLYSHANAIVLQTEDSRSCFPKKLQRKIAVIPNPLPDELPVPNTTSNRDKTIMTAGRLVVQKNIPLLIDAFADFHLTHPQYTLNIYGKGQMEEKIQSCISEKQMQNSVFMRGFTDNLYHELLTQGMYVSSSDSEGISNSLVEALSAGIPTIATDCPIGGSKMCIRNEVNGILIQPGEKQALTKAMCMLADNQEMAGKMSVEAIKVRETFSLSHIGQMWLEVTNG